MEISIFGRLHNYELYASQISSPFNQHFRLFHTFLRLAIRTAHNVKDAIRTRNNVQDAIVVVGTL